MTTCGGVFGIGLPGQVGGVCSSRLQKAWNAVSKVSQAVLGEQGPEGQGAGGKEGIKAMLKKFWKKMRVQMGAGLGVTLASW